MSRRKGMRFLSLLLSIQGTLLVLPSIYGRSNPPKLVVVLVVDGLGQGQLLKLRDQLEPDGFRRFLDGGAWFSQGRYRHATTLTATGHATISTGALPVDQEIVGNDWFDQDTQRRVYCVEDQTSPWLGEPLPHRDREPRHIT